MILPRLRRNLECPADQVFASIVRRIRTPGPLRASRRQVPPMTTRRALPRRRSGRTARRCRDALTLAARHEMHSAEVPVSPSGAASSAGASAGPRLSAVSCWRPRTPGRSSPSTTSLPHLQVRRGTGGSPGLHLRRAPPRPRLTARRAAAHPLLDTDVASLVHRRKHTGPLATRLITREPQRTSDSADERMSVRPGLVPGMVTSAKPVDQGSAVSTRLHDFHDDCLRRMGRKERRYELAIVSRTATACRVKSRSRMPSRATSMSRPSPASESFGILSP
jgi:hypothetical protein